VVVIDHFGIYTVITGGGMLITNICLDRENAKADK